MQRKDNILYEQSFAIIHISTEFLMRECQPVVRERQNVSWDESILVALGGKLKFACTSLKIIQILLSKCETFD